MSRETFEPNLMKVDRSGRVIIPQHFCERVGWIMGDSPLKAWLLMGGPGRYRLVPDQEVETNSELRTIHAMATAAVADHTDAVLDFEDEASAALSARFVATQISPPGPGWRLMLPKAATSIMRIRPGEDDVAVLLSKGYIEIWTIDTLKSALTVPLRQII